MAKKIDDFYRKALWYTSLTTTDFPFIYSSGGAYSFHEALHDVYSRLIREIVATGGDHFMEKATFDLVADQQEYTLPSDTIKLREIELQYDGTNWARASKRDLSNLTHSTEAATLSAASEYSPLFDVLEDSFFIYPEPNTARTNGGKLWYIKAPATSLFISAVSAASATITFPQEYEHLIPMGIAIELWGKYGANDREASIKAQYDEGVEKMKREIKPRTRPGQVRMLDGNREIGNR